MSATFLIATNKQKAIMIQMANRNNDLRKGIIVWVLDYKEESGKRPFDDYDLDELFAKLSEDEVAELFSDFMGYMIDNHI